ncbi:transposase, partial [Periweissella ghanensis]|uniref:transposase n=1 Tax=Periweissella ghanensis TaxID=467997 RepID=UPI002030C7F3
MAVELTETLTAKYIAKTYNVSFNSIQRASKLWFQTNQPRFSWLPQHIAFDDFKSGSFAKAGMSVIVVDILRHRLLDVIKDRTNIVGYFSQYNIEARRAVKTVTVDLFTPYRKAIHELFPNAVI